MTDHVGLRMKYFVLKPSGNSGDEYARASRSAMQRYAQVIEGVNPVLAKEVLDWAEVETRLAYGLPAKASPVSAAADLLVDDGWVSVEERMPEKMSSVIFWCESSRQIGWAFYSSIGEWCGSDGRLAGVSHWRPIPAPPGGDHG